MAHPPTSATAANNASNVLTESRETRDARWATRAKTATIFFGVVFAIALFSALGTSGSSQKDVAKVFAIITGGSLLGLGVAGAFWQIYEPAPRQEPQITENN